MASPNLRPSLSGPFAPPSGSQPVSYAGTSNFPPARLGFSASAAPPFTGRCRVTATVRATNRFPNSETGPPRRRRGRWHAEIAHSVNRRDPGSVRRRKLRAVGKRIRGEPESAVTSFKSSCAWASALCNRNREPRNSHIYHPRFYMETRRIRDPLSLLCEVLLPPHPIGKATTFCLESPTTHISCHPQMRGQHAVLH